MYLIFNKMFQNPIELQSPNSSPHPSPTIAMSPNLKSAVDNALSGSKGTYAIFIKNLKTGETYAVNEHQQFDSGSLYKLWIMVTAFNQIKDGSLLIDETLTEDIADLNQKFEIDDEDAELTDGAISLTTASAIEQMITISHNYAALLLTDRIKLSEAKKLIDSYSFTETTLNPPKTTAADTELFLEKLYHQQIIDPEYSQKMLEVLKRQKLNDKLPKNLPPGTIIAHKTGEIGYLSHDAGIVFSDKGDYVIVVLSDTSSPTGAEDRIADISKNVYDYFEGR